MRHIRQEHVRLFHHIGSSLKFLLVIFEKRVHGRSGSGFLWCLEKAIAQSTCTAVSAFRAILTVFARSRSSCWSSFCFKVWEEHFSTIWSLVIFSSKVPKSQDFTSPRRLDRQVRVERLVCPLCSRPEFVAFYYHVPFRGKVPIQGGLGFSEALVFARERVENALHCGAKAIQHRGSLKCILLFL